MTNGEGVKKDQAQGAENLAQFVLRMDRLLASAGIEDSRREVRLILAETMDLPLERQYLLEREDLKASWRERAESVFRRRALREPLSSILEAKEFYGYRFHLNEACLAPRPETEELVTVALELLADTKWKRRDLHLAEWCCGSGAPGLSLLAEVKKQRADQEIRLDLSDLSARALEAAQRNAKQMGLEAFCRFDQADLFPSRECRYDMILCNPPYIPSADLAGLMPEVRNYEPELCLDGGSDGLDFYRRLAAGAREYMRKPGALIMEHGIGQNEAVREIFSDWQKQKARFRVRRDLAGLERVAVLEI